MLRGPSYQPGAKRHSLVPPSSTPCKVRPNISLECSEHFGFELGSWVQSKLLICRSSRQPLKSTMRTCWSGTSTEACEAVISPLQKLFLNLISTNLLEVMGTCRCVLPQEVARPTWPCWQSWMSWTSSAWRHFSSNEKTTDSPHLPAFWHTSSSCIAAASSLLSGWLLRLGGLQDCLRSSHEGCPAVFQAVRGFVYWHI